MFGTFNPDSLPYALLQAVGQREALEYSAYLGDVVFNGEALLDLDKGLVASLCGRQERL